MNNRRNVLIMSLLFAPNAAVGAKRFSFLSDILSDGGFNIHTLTIKENLIEKVDMSFSGGGDIHRATMFPRFPVPVRGLASRVFRRLWEDRICLLDPYSGWILPAIVKGAEIIRKNRIQILIVSGPPFSPFVAAAILQMITGVKLVLDYRDPWTSHEYLIHGPKYKNPTVRQINRQAEKFCIKRSTVVVTCSDIMKALFIEKFPWASKRDIKVVHNGYWPHSVQSKSMGQPLYLDAEKKVMIYAGELYGERRVEIVARPLRRLIDKGVISAESFKFFVFGRIDEKDRQVLRELDLEGVISQKERVDYSVMVRYLEGADILFLPSGAKVDYAIPFKFYDYLRARRPILALTPDDSQLGRIMRTIDCGETADIRDTVAIESALARMIMEERTYTFKGSESYTWASAAQNYARLIERAYSAEESICPT